MIGRKLPPNSSLTTSAKANYTLINLHHDMTTIQQILPLAAAQSEVQYSIQPASPEVSSALPSAVAERTGSSRELVSLVSQAVLEQIRIRAMLVENEGHALALLAVELQTCAIQYTGCVKTDDLVFDECVEFIIERFAGLHIDEIRHAFRLAASGELGEIKLEAYFGTFTVAMLGRILTAYEQYRKKIVADVMEANRKAGFAQAQILKSINWNSDEWAQGRLNFFGSKSEFSVDDVSAADFFYFVQDKVELPEPERRLDWQKAWDLAILDVQKAIGRGEVGAAALLRKVQSGLKDEGFRDKRINYYRRLLALRWITSQKNSTVHQ